MVLCEMVFCSLATVGTAMIMYSLHFLPLRCGKVVYGGMLLLCAASCLYSVTHLWVCSVIYTHLIRVRRAISCRAFPALLFNSFWMASLIGFLICHYLFMMYLAILRLCSAPFFRTLRHYFTPSCLAMRRTASSSTALFVTPSLAAISASRRLASGVRRILVSSLVSMHTNVPRSMLCRKAFCEAPL